MKNESGVALILVLLAMLVLSVLAASIVFTARSETFASYNYRLDTQADYLAKAGIQRAVNWLRSDRYRAVRPDLAPTYYFVTQVSPILFPNLYTSNFSPVKCKAVALGCPTANAIVQLMGYGTGLQGSAASNYPAAIFNAAGTAVSPAFAADINDPAFVNNRISADPANSGYFTVNATLLNYQSVNVTPPPAPIPPSCIQTTIVTCPVETWLITAKATWTGAQAATATVATAEEIAIVQPIYWPTWGNALYGFCSVSMIGSNGTCTDAFNSALGPYAAGNGSVASGVCDQSTFANVIDTGAGVGANGGVTLGANVTVGGNVTIGTSPSAGCAATPGCPTCNSTNVSGEVVDGPHINPPPLPIFPAGFPPGASSDVSLNNASPALTLPAGAFWPALGTPPPPNPAWPYVPPSAGPPLAIVDPTHCIVGLVCNGSAPDPVTGQGPYLIRSISMTGSTLNLVGGTNPTNPVYYDIECIQQTGGSINISGYVVLNVQGQGGAGCGGATNLDLEGNGISNGIPCTAPCSNIPPVALTINYAGTTRGVKIGGNGAISGVLNAPLADVALGGGGANGYMVGAIQANNVSVQGGYPIHYDVQLGRVGGSLGTLVTTAYGRKKM